MFVPPPPEALAGSLDEREQFVHEDDGLPPLITCALIHHQLETIHPVSDGDGRVGHLLMPLFLVDRQCLSRPLLHLSAIFEKDRSTNHETLSEGRRTGDLDLFAVATTEARRQRVTHAAAQDATVDRAAPRRRGVTSG